MEPRGSEPEPVQVQKPAPVAAAVVPTVEAPAVEPPCDPNAPAEIEREEVDPDDPDVRKRDERARRKPARGIAEKLKVAVPTHRAACEVSLGGPCSASGDLDGDGQRDEVVLVRSDRGEGGLVILWGAGGAALLGAGQRCQTWTVTELANLRARGRGGPVRLGVSEVAALGEALVATGFPYVRVSDNLPEVVRLVPKIRCLRRGGSAALDLAYVAAGRLDGYWEARLAPWDVAAGILLVREAGGVVTRMHGEAWTLEYGDVTAGGQWLHAQLVGELQAARG